MDSAEKTNTWEFIVISKEKSVSFITVEQNGSDYITTGFGGSSNNLNEIYNKVIRNKNVISPIILADTQCYKSLTCIYIYDIIYICCRYIYIYIYILNSIN
ncbi:UNVERIFIED_CONTAM: hypothetical protein Cloal_1728 [Acetivibrio alkalicellulosi]